jgi:large subunit ribosomal protein L6
MSRKGKMPIPLPKGVEVKVSDTEVSVKGPKGQLHQKLISGVHVAVQSDQVVVSLAEDSVDMGKFHGLYRALVNNMVIGATQGFEVRLQTVGVGYRAAVVGNQLAMYLGFSHPTEFPIPVGITVKVDKNTEITIMGADKQQVGQFAAMIRSIRPPEPYQGKGVRYLGEEVRKKAGKAAAKK